MDFTKNVTFIDTINTSVKGLMKDGKIDKYDIPALVLLITDLIEFSNTGSKVTVTTQQIAESIDSLYSYIMSHYNLFPEDDVQKMEFKACFDMCVKLALFQPNINKEIKSVFACFK